MQVRQTGTSRQSRSWSVSATYPFNLPSMALAPPCGKHQRMPQLFAGESVGLPTSPSGDRLHYGTACLRRLPDHGQSRGSYGPPQSPGLLCQGSTSFSLALPGAAQTGAVARDSWPRRLHKLQTLKNLPPESSRLSVVLSIALSAPRSSVATSPACGGRSAASGSALPPRPAQISVPCVNFAFSSTSGPLLPSMLHLAPATKAALTSFCRSSRAGWRILLYGFNSYGYLSCAWISPAPDLQPLNLKHLAASPIPLSDRTSGWNQALALTCLG